MTPILLDIHHGFNFRDLGGYATTTGQRVKPGRLIRAGRLNELSEHDLQTLTDYGLAIDVDFRSPQERTEAPDRLPAGVDYQFAPVFPTDETQVSKKTTELRANFATDPAAGFQHMVNMYANLVVQASAHQAYRHFFDLLLANATPGALLFHCTAGKDRTGMGAVFLLTALGVDAPTVRADYLASNALLTVPRQRTAAKIRATGGSDALLASTKALGSVDAAYLDAALTTITHTYGSLAAYLTDVLGVTAAQTRELRQLYLE
ncbi:tyrosine-protein phosphatase [Lacticaseibacillus daqingensis]|uniref:tyrosine-protein phosphatase n=1 Tax=Lacticaseibacillus daqingensis TaxID=2486014 RepID=UPI000F785B96|nr:tyrosine-protein phosphatase [Lacticaseibacillus daqingensis]